MTLDSAVVLAKELKTYPLQSEGEGEGEGVGEGVGVGERAILVGDGPFDQDWPKDEAAFEWIARRIQTDRTAEMSLSTLGNLRRLSSNANHEELNSYVFLTQI